MGKNIALKKLNIRDNSGSQYLVEKIKITRKTGKPSTVSFA